MLYGYLCKKKMNRGIEDLKQKFSNNSILTTDELIFLSENFVDTILIKGRFDNTVKAFYTHSNFLKLSKLIVFHDQLKFSHLLKKIDKIHLIEIKLFNKEAKLDMLFGIFLVLLGVVCLFLVIYNFGELNPSLLSLLIIGAFIFGFLWYGLLIFLLGTKKHQQFK
jgi:hypothetical protein